MSTVPNLFYGILISNLKQYKFATGWVKKTETRAPKWWSVTLAGGHYSEVVINSSVTVVAKFDGSFKM